MVKPIHDYQFRLVQGVWRDVLGNNGDILANVLEDYDIVVDDKAEFIRFKDYERGYSIYYRAFGGKITLTIWKLD